MATAFARYFLPCGFDAAHLSRSLCAASGAIGAVLIFNQVWHSGVSTWGACKGLVEQPAVKLISAMTVIVLTTSIARSSIGPRVNGL